MVALGIPGTALAYLLFFGLITGAGAAYASLVTYLIPPIALAYGAIFLGERFGASAFGGLALILAGVALGTGACGSADTSRVANERNRQLRDLAQRIADALPPEAAEEVVLTGSVSRGMADDVSDIEMLIVTPEQLELDECFVHARAAGLENVDSWGDQSTPSRRVSGLLEGVPIELIWWSRELAESSIDAFFEASNASSGADAIANGVPLRTSGALARWQARLADYPEELAKARIEAAALPWGGFAAAGLLTFSGRTIAWRSSNGTSTARCASSRSSTR